MLSKKRIWLIKAYATPEELAQALTNTWVLCAGFEHAGYLYLNDSSSEDSAFELGIVRKSDLVQVESITFGWLGQGITRGNNETHEDYRARQLAAQYAATLAEIITITQGGYKERYATIRPDQITYDPQHHCGYCA